MERILNPEHEKTRKLQKSKSMEFLKAKLLSRKSSTKSQVQPLQPHQVTTDIDILGKIDSIFTRRVIFTIIRTKRKQLQLSRPAIAKLRKKGRIPKLLSRDS